MKPRFTLSTPPPGMLAHVCIPNTQEAEAGKWETQSLLGYTVSSTSSQEEYWIRGEGRKDQDPPPL